MPDVFHLTNADCVETADTLAQLFAEDDTSADAGCTRVQFSGQGNRGVQAAGARPGTTGSSESSRLQKLGRVLVVPDPRTSAVFVNAAETLMPQIRYGVARFKTTFPKTHLPGGCARNRLAVIVNDTREGMFLDEFWENIQVVDVQTRERSMAKKAGPGQKYQEYQPNKIGANSSHQFCGAGASRLAARMPASSSLTGLSAGTGIGTAGVLRATRRRL